MPVPKVSVLERVDCTCTVQGSFQEILDHYMFRGNYPPTSPLIYKPTLTLTLYFSLRAKCWLRGRVGEQFPRNGTCIMIRNSLFQVYVGFML